MRPSHFETTPLSLSPRHPLVTGAGRGRSHITSRRRVAGKAGHRGNFRPGRYNRPCIPAARLGVQHPQPRPPLACTSQLGPRFSSSVCHGHPTVMWVLTTLLALLSVALANPDAKRLYDDLLSNYNRLIRPVSNNTDTVLVKLGLRLSQLIDLVSAYS